MGTLKQSKIAKLKIKIENTKRLKNKAYELHDKYSEQLISQENDLIKLTSGLFIRF